MKAQWFMIQDVFPQNTYIQAYPTNTFYIKKDTFTDTFLIATTYIKKYVWSFKSFCTQEYLNQVLPYFVYRLSYRWWNPNSHTLQMYAPGHLSKTGQIN